VVIPIPGFLTPPLIPPLPISANPEDAIFDDIVLLPSPNTAEFRGSDMLTLLVSPLLYCILQYSSARHKHNTEEHSYTVYLINVKK
jgi:hypothetical protein